MSLQAKIEVRELTPARLDDYLRFFDKDAFTDFPEWSGCYADSTTRPVMSGTLLPRLGLLTEWLGPNASDQARPTVF